MTAPPNITGIRMNAPNQMCGLELMSQIPDDTISVAFFDPQYEGILKKQAFGSVNRQVERHKLAQMPETTIKAFIASITRCLTPSGYLFLWMDKYHLLEGFDDWLQQLVQDTRFVS